MSVFIKNSGVPAKVKDVFINVSNVWKTAKSVWVKNTGVWTNHIYVTPSNLVAYGNTAINRGTGTQSGASYTWIVPAGVSKITVKGSGGGGGSYAYHDGGYGQHAWAGAPGGAFSVTINVSSGDVINGVYGDAGGSGYYNGGVGGPGSATTVYKNGVLIATGGAGGNNPGGSGATLGTATITAGYLGSTYTGTNQADWVNGSDGSYPGENHYDPWSWVTGGSYPQSTLGTVALEAPYQLGTNYQRAGMPQANGWVSISW